MSSDDPRYPIGRPVRLAGSTAEQRAELIQRIATLPERLSELIPELGPAELDTSYREGGWTARQLVHHLADSHVHAYVRLKLALTEEMPTIKPYDEEAWAGLPDVESVPVEVSQQLLAALHVRLAAVFRALPEGGFARSFQHPEHGRAMTVEELLGIYAWHGDHHLAHLRLILDRRGLEGEASTSADSAEGAGGRGLT
jgi:uncharacterized damage-inducible protein DinB